MGALCAASGMSQSQPRFATGTPGRLNRDQSKVKKIEWYADQLASRATSRRGVGNTQGAIEDYLKAADILMLLAKDESDYPIWKRYMDKATACQQNVKIILKAQP